MSRDSDPQFEEYARLINNSLSSSIYLNAYQTPRTLDSYGSSINAPFLAYDYKLLKSFLCEIDNLPESVAYVVRGLMLAALYTPFARVLAHSVNSENEQLKSNEQIQAHAERILKLTKVSEAFLVEGLAHHVLDSLGYLDEPVGEATSEYEKIDRQIRRHLLEIFGPYTRRRSLNDLASKL